MDKLFQLILELEALPKQSDKRDRIKGLASRLYSISHELDLISSRFNWKKWERGLDYLEWDREKGFADFGLSECRMFLTVLVRNERFVENSLSEYILDGTVLQLLKRIQQLHTNSSITKELLKIDDERIGKEDLTRLLEQKHLIDNEIKRRINEFGFRLSTNKLLGDLAEFFVVWELSIERKIFETLKQPATSNYPYDLEGIPSKWLKEKLDFKEDKLRVEVKARRNEKNKPHLRNIHPDKFDLLVFVDLYEDYTLNDMHMVESTMVASSLEQKFNRIVFDSKMAFWHLSSNG